MVFGGLGYCIFQVLRGSLWLVVWSKTLPASGVGGLTPIQSGKYLTVPDEPYCTSGWKIMQAFPAVEGGPNPEPP